MRLLVTVGGAVGLAVAGLVPPLYALGALVLIAVPTNAGVVKAIFGHGNGKK